MRIRNAIEIEERRQENQGEDAQVQSLPDRKMATHGDLTAMVGSETDGAANSPTSTANEEEIPEQ